MGAPVGAMEAAGTDGAEPVTGVGPGLAGAGAVAGAGAAWAMTGFEAAGASGGGAGDAGAGAADGVVPAGALGVACAGARGGGCEAVDWALAVESRSGNEATASETAILWFTEAPLSEAARCSASVSDP